MQTASGYGADQDYAYRVTGTDRGAVACATTQPGRSPASRLESLSLRCDSATVTALHTTGTRNDWAGPWAIMPRRLDSISLTGENDGSNLLARVHLAALTNRRTVRRLRDNRHRRPGKRGPQIIIATANVGCRAIGGRLDPRYATAG